MADSSKPPALDYKSVVRGKVPVRTAEENRWLWRRVFLYVGLDIFALLIAFYFGPHVILFGKLGPRQPADLAPQVERDYAPVVLAMKEYRREHGVLPNDPRVLFVKTPERQRVYSLMGTKCNFYDYTFNEVVVYDFTPGDEHWEMRGHFAEGRIPFPTVMLPPATTSSAPGTR
jgi:hypothetical protein